MDKETYNQYIFFMRSQIHNYKIQKPFRYRVVLYSPSHRSLVIQVAQLEPTGMNAIEAWYMNFSPIHVMHIYPFWENVELELLEYDQAIEYLKQHQIPLDTPLPRLVFRALIDDRQILIQCSSVYITDTFPRDPLGVYNYLEDLEPNTSSNNQENKQTKETNQ
ncbi:MAG: hypothetical protein AAF639_43055 [Chloroflexota bacterium]